MVVFRNRETPGRTQTSRVLIMGTPQTGLPIWGMPHVLAARSRPYLLEKALQGSVAGDAAVRTDSLGSRSNFEGFLLEGSYGSFPK